MSGLSGYNYNDLDVSVEKTKSYSCNQEIYGMEACNTRGQGFLISRHASACVLYSWNGESLTALDELDITEGRPTSQSLSPYIPGECLVATNDGNVFLWSTDKKELVIRNMTTRFPCREDWVQAIFSSHPRKIIVTDCTVAQSIDIRCNTEHVDLFALPSKFIHPRERIRIVKQHSDFLYVVATDFSLVVVDERFPNHPILQWQHSLRRPPQYLQILPEVGEVGHSLIVIASQNPMEAYCFTFQVSQSNSVQSIGTPWKLSRIDDFTKWDEICHVLDRVALEERYKTDSLLGLNLMPLKDGFLSFQLDSYCDLYYQVYTQGSNKNDKTFSAGPGMNNLKLDEITKEKGGTWVREIIKREKHQDQSEAMQSSCFEEIILQRPSHNLCSLCHDQDSDFTQDSDEFCHSCRKTLETSTKIRHDAIQDRVTSLTSSDLSSLPLVSSLPTDVLSNMITRLWNNESVDDLLSERDEEIKNKLLKRKEMRKKKKGSGPSDFLSTMRQLVDENDDDRQLDENAEIRGSDEYESRQLDEDEIRELDESINLDENDVESRQLDKNDKITVETSLMESRPVVSGETNGPSSPICVTIRTTGELSQSPSRKRQRHSSVSSLGSVNSTDIIPGFMRTPVRINSPRKKQVTTSSQEIEICNLDLSDEEFLSQKSKEEMLKQIKPDSGRKNTNDLKHVKQKRWHKKKSFPGF